jgi:tRNA G18 (ribose-2'-O)-methylase SpoU
MRDIVLIAHNLRSTHNVGSLLRTAEGLGLTHVYLTGYTPYPEQETDKRLPHIARKVGKDINKTALDAETMIGWTQSEDIAAVIVELKKDSYSLVAIEQSPSSVKLPDYQPADKIALLVGREVEGVEPEILALCDAVVEIPMFGKKESFNVVQAAAMAMYHCRFTND